MFHLLKSQTLFWFKPKPEPQAELDFPLAEIWFIWRGQIPGQENNFNWTVLNRSRGHEVRIRKKRWRSRSDCCKAWDYILDPEYKFSEWYENAFPLSAFQWLAVGCGTMSFAPSLWLILRLVFSFAPLDFSSDLFCWPMTSPEARSLLEHEIRLG